MSLEAKVALFLIADSIIFWSFDLVESPSTVSNIILFSNNCSNSLIARIASLAENAVKGLNL